MYCFKMLENNYHDFPFCALLYIIISCGHWQSGHVNTGDPRSERDQPANPRENMGICPSSIRLFQRATPRLLCGYVTGETASPRVPDGHRQVKYATEIHLRMNCNPYNTRFNFTTYHRNLCDVMHRSRWRNNGRAFQCALFTSSNQTWFVLCFRI
jgi:hypothetical protein